MSRNRAAPAGTMRQAGPDTDYDLGAQVYRNHSTPSSPFPGWRDKRPKEAQACLRSHSSPDRKLELHSSIAPCLLPNWGDDTTTEASISWALPECPSHHFPSCLPGGVLFSSSQVTSSERLNTPPWSTAWNSAHQALGTATIPRGSTRPGALIVGEARPGQGEGNAADPKEGSGAGLGREQRGPGLLGNWGDP